MSAVTLSSGPIYPLLGVPITDEELEKVAACLELASRMIRDGAGPGGLRPSELLAAIEAQTA